MCVSMIMLLMKMIMCNLGQLKGGSDKQEPNLYNILSID